MPVEKLALPSLQSETDGALKSVLFQIAINGGYFMTWAHTRVGEVSMLFLPAHRTNINTNIDRGDSSRY